LYNDISVYFLTSLEYTEKCAEENGHIQQYHYLRFLLEAVDMNAKMMKIKNESN
jgi:hypothetical protein